MYVKGLPAELTEKDFASRFGSFGSVSDVSIAKSACGDCRGFGHLSLMCDDSGWRKCLSLLNGSTWKGKKISIEEAKEDYIKRRDKEMAQAPITDKKDVLKRRLVRHATDMSLVDEKNVEKRKGWRRGKFGRPIAIVRLRKPDGTLVVHDPSHDPNALDKFYEGYHPRPIRKLTWFSSVIIEGTEFEQSDHNEPVSNAKMEESTPGPVPVAVNGEEGFSLAALLNLPKVEIVQEKISPVVKTTKSTNDSTVVRAQPYPLRKLMYDFSSLFNEPLDLNKMLIAASSKLESLTVWKANRSEIRQDFKKQAKAAKRQIRKKKVLTNQNRLV